MNRKTLLSAFACATLMLAMAGCGQTNDLKSLQLSTSNTTEDQPGSPELFGIGGTVQLYTWGNYSDGKQQLLDTKGGAVVYHIVLTPDSSASVGTLGDPNADPAQTVEMTSTGLLTAVAPFACSFSNSAVPPATTPAWGVSGSYTVTASYSGLTTPPVYIPVASASGVTDSTNPTGECGNPPSTP